MKLIYFQLQISAPKYFVDNSQQHFQKQWISKKYVDTYNNHEIMKCLNGHTLLTNASNIASLLFKENIINAINDNII